MSYPQIIGLWSWNGYVRQTFTHCVVYLTTDGYALITEADRSVTTFLLPSEY